jgi:hypothetical protein
MPTSLGQLRVTNPVMTGLTSNCKNNKNATCKYIKCKCIRSNCIKCKCIRCKCTRCKCYRCKCTKNVTPTMAATTARASNTSRTTATPTNWTEMRVIPIKASAEPDEGGCKLS